MPLLRSSPQIRIGIGLAIVRAADRRDHPDLSLERISLVMTPRRPGARWYGAALVLAVISVATVPLTASTSTATLTVTATVAAECTVGAATLAFGAYSTLGSSNLDQSTSFNVACTSGTSATIGLNLGSNASGSTRRLANGGGGFLTYELYSDSGRSTVWGNSGGALVNYSASSNAAEAFTVYGRIPGAQNAAIGSYSDSVTITVTF
jgi:spore coat protein U-like protein